MVVTSEGSSIEARQSGLEQRLPEPSQEEGLDGLPPVLLGCYLPGELRNVLFLRPFRLP